MSTAPSKETSGQQSAAALSPFPPIADYAFLSNCHTGALVAPDGAVDWLCVPSFDSPERVRQPARPRRRLLPVRPVRHRTSHRPRLRAGHERAGHHLEDAERLGGGARRADDGAAPPGRTRSRRTPGRRPTTTPTTCWCARSSASRARSRSSWSASRCSTTAASPADVDAGRRRAATPPTPPAPATRSGCSTDMRLGIEGERRPRPARAARARRASARCRGPRSWPPRPTTTTPSRRIDATVRFWRNWLARARIPDHRWRDPIERSALTIKGLTYMPTGATVAALTTSLPETPGGERNWDYRYTWMRDTTFTLQALHYLNLDWEADEFMQFVADLEPNRGRQPADHVRHRRPPRPHRVDPRRAVRLRGRPSRCGSGTAPSTSARTTCSARCWTRSCCTPGAASGCRRRLWPLVESQAAVRDRGLARARPGHLGGARRSRSTTCRRS